MGYIYVQEHYGGGRHIEAAWSLISEGLYSQELDFMNTRASNVFSLCLLDHKFSDPPTRITMHSRLPLSVERCESLFHQETPWEARQCMCGGDDHLAWKHSISLEVCRGLHTDWRVQSLLLGFPLTHPLIFRATLSLQAKLRPHQDSLPTHGCICGLSKPGQQ